MADGQSADRHYSELQDRLGSGWNTWDVRSMTAHVLMPHGLSVRLGIKEYGRGGFLADALIGRPEPESECVRPGVRSYDGRYTDMELSWRGIDIRVESAADEHGLVVLVTPGSNAAGTAGLRQPALVVSAGFLWNRAGTVTLVDGGLEAVVPSGELLRVTSDGRRCEDRNIPVHTPFLTVSLAGQPIVICVGRQRTVTEVRALLAAKRQGVLAGLAAVGDGSPGTGEAAAAVQCALAWNTIYDPDHARVISPVSRVWSTNQGGWVLFCWDTYFAGLLAGLTGNRDLAYANLVEITRHATSGGFVPNTANAHGFVTRDRSQPPVGSMMLLELFRRYGDRWIVELLFEPLLKWNRWWPAARRVRGGCLAWGSNPYDPVVGNEWETEEKGVGGRFGGSLESGMDNSPAYDDAAYDPATHTLALADVGLTSLYVADCLALADLSRAIGRDAEAAELSARAAEFTGGLASLWCEPLGIFANRRTDTQEFSHRLTPAHFYPLLVPGLVKADQARRMIDDHLMAPGEFGGPWMLPSCPRSDAAYAEQHYWRGRIWPPHVLLVWLGLCRSGHTEAAGAVAANASSLLLREWRSHGHVHENYHADSGDACGYRWSDPLYHWGGLLGAPRLFGGC